MPARFLHQPRPVPPERDGKENSSKNCASPTFSLLTLAPSALVPPLCPSCGAPGLHPLPIRKADDQNRLPPLEAHYCDLCAQSLESETTRRLASTLAASIIAVAFATALTFYWGLRFPLIQWLLVIAVSAGIPWLAQQLSVWQIALPAVEELDRGSIANGERTLLARNEVFAQALLDAGMQLNHEEVPPDNSLSGKFRKRWPIWLVLSLGVAWWGLLHFLGVAQVRVIYGGERSATFLIDDRHSGELSATYSEDPEAGRILQVLGGRRKFALMSSQGALVAEEKTTIWPGGTYIVAVLPTGMCLFSETMSYGQKGSGSLLVPLSGQGPVWEVEGQVDSWFQPLASPRTAATNDSESGEVASSADVEKSLSGGSRRAIRLLACRPSLAR